MINETVVLRSASVSLAELQFVVCCSDDGMNRVGPLSLTDLAEHFGLLNQSADPGEHSQVYGFVSGSDQKEDVGQTSAWSPKGNAASGHTQT